jgi:teichuronic acid biosynthesis glycosyltransferase TuaG
MKNENYLVSIITPAYNCSDYISQTIESVLAQTYTNWELLIVNDKSTDNTEDIINEYLTKDNRIRLINHEMNSGPAVARNTALEEARGRFIAFLDSDDVWKKEKLEKQIGYMLKNNYGFTFTAYEFMKLSNSDTTRIIEVPTSIDYKQNLKNTIIGCLTVIIDREIIGDFRMPLIRIAQDHSTWLLILKKGHYAYGLNESLAEYRRSPGSLSGNKIKALKGEWENYRDVIKIPLIKRCYYFSWYVFNAIKKHYFL